MTVRAMVTKFGVVLTLIAVLVSPRTAEPQGNQPARRQALQSPPPTCHGLPATIYVRDGRIVGGPDHGRPYRGFLRGTPGDDVIVGTAGRDLIMGLDGNDTICGGDGNDIIDGGAGDDWIEGGAGQDLLRGQAGHDVIKGGDGDDWIDGGEASDRLDGGTGRNFIFGGTGVDTCINGRHVAGCNAVTPRITIVNNLPTSAVCPGGNTVTVFTGGPPQQPIQPNGGSMVVTGDFAAFPGVGLQVNNWYWTSVSLPVQAGNPQNGTPQNPDNSGAQFAISDQCVLSHEPAWFGKGIPTYEIATVSAASTAAGCTITIVQNSYTDAVTPSCCAPPGIGSATCSGPWGVTNSGQPWPPSE